jgi:NAD(P)H-dependent FMN reductase
VKPVLQVLVASTRPGRVGLPIGVWLAAAARQHGAFEVDLVDLAVLKLPFFDEPAHPRLRNYSHRHTKEWSARVDRADAFAFVMPEYNYGYSAPLKNAIDYLHREWQYKPVGLVSYGGVSGGTRAAQMIKQVVTTLKMHPLSEAVPIPFVAQLLDDEGRLEPTQAMATAAGAMFDELVRVEAALRALRESPADGLVQAR